jgi:mono/diheme cytochrome c family protein
MFWTGEQGGEISHGEDYLTEHMPARLQRWLGVEAPQAKPAVPAVAPKTAYAARVEPLLRRSCVSCHNATKAKGGLRLDTYAWLMHGSKDGVVVVPWDPENSELIRRVSLPSSDEDFMPSDGRKPLSPEEVKLVGRWIAAGASAAQPANTLP